MSISAPGGQQQVAVDLARVRLLRAFVHDRLAVEHAAALVGGDAAVVLQAGGLDRAMVDVDVRVEVPRAVGQEHAGHFGAAARPSRLTLTSRRASERAELRVPHHEAWRSRRRGLRSARCGRRARPGAAGGTRVRCAPAPSSMSSTALVKCSCAPSSTWSSSRRARLPGGHAHGDAGARKSRAGARGQQRELQDVVALLASRQWTAAAGRCVKCGIERCEAFGAAAGRGRSS